MFKGNLLVSCLLDVLGYIDKGQYYKLPITSKLIHQ